MKPFKLQHGPITDDWYIVLEHPNDINNFVIPFRSKEYKGCEPVLESLNNLIQVHWDLNMNKLRQDIINELGEIEP